MTVDVYADILFLINAGMDGLCLLLTSKLLHIPQKTWRLLLASGLGGVYAVFALLMSVGEFGALLIDILVCFLMCVISFGSRRGLKRLPLWSGVYVAISMLMGGMMTGIYHLLQRSGISAWLSDGGDDSLSSVAFVLLAGVGGVLTHTFSKFFKKKQAIQTGTLILRQGENRLTLTAMVDSGNLLRDPMGGSVVIPVRVTSVKSLFSPVFGTWLSRQNMQDEGLWEMPEAHRIRLIPTHTAMGEGMMVAVRLDEVVWCADGKEGYRVHALIAPTDLSGSPVDALVPREFLD